jgi:uncharacterized protein
VAVPSSPPLIPSASVDDDRIVVAELLGRLPQGAFEVVVRDLQGKPVVIKNAPLLDNGEPMPTTYWLIGPVEIRAVGRLESTGGVRQAEAAINPGAIAAAHDRYAAEREAMMPVGHVGPRPSGGVAGTRRGVKCLHAHYAWFLAGGPDPVGAWVARQLATGASAATRSAASVSTTAEVDKAVAAFADPTAHIVRDTATTKAPTVATS